jgi:hypothetical protein
MLCLLAAILAIRAPSIPSWLRVGHGKAVAGVAKDDFRVLNDGKMTIIASFVVEKTPYSTIIPSPSKNAPEPMKPGLPASSARPQRYLALFIEKN